MKVIFRPHRGSLSQSVKESKIFNDVDEMKEYILKYHNGYITLEDIVICEPESDDDRIGWKKVQSVCTNRYGKDNYIELYGVPQCIGNMTYEWDDK